MSSASQFLGGARATKAIVNADSSGGTAPRGGISAANTPSAREVLSGALTAATLASVLSITGAGELSYLSAYTKDTTSRTVRLRVTVDGVVVFNATSAATTSSLNGIQAVGFSTGSNGLPSTTPVRFSTSLLVEIASSLTETDKVAIAYSAQTF